MYHAWHLHIMAKASTYTSHNIPKNMPKYSNNIKYDGTPTIPRKSKKNCMYAINKP